MKSLMVYQNKGEVQKHLLKKRSSIQTAKTIIQMLYLVLQN